MKKKLLITLLVVALIGILAFTVFACKKDTPKSTEKKDPVVVVEEDVLGNCLKDVVKAVDNTIKPIGDITNKASVDATIFVEVDTGDEDVAPVKLAVRIAGSLDAESAAKNWVLVEIKDENLNEGVVSIYAKNTGDKEYVYLGQGATASEFKWVKLSQIENADLLSNTVTKAVFDLLGKIDTATKAKLTGGVVGSIASDSLIDIISPIAANAFEAKKTTDGYELVLNASGLGQLLKDLKSLVDVEALVKDYIGIVDVATNLLLGGTIGQMVGGTFDASKAPTLTIGATIASEKLSGISIAYAKETDDKTVAVKFGIKNLALSATSAAATDPSPAISSAEEFALKASLKLDVPGIAAEEAKIDLVVYPDVKLSFLDDETNTGKAMPAADYEGYVALDFSGLKGYATLSMGSASAVTIADFDAENAGFNIDLTPVFTACGVSTDGVQTKYFIALDPQGMFDGWIEDMVEVKSFTKYYSATTAGAAAKTAYITAWKADNAKGEEEAAADYDDRANAAYEAVMEGVITGIQEEGASLVYDEGTETYAWYGAEVIFADRWASATGTAPSSVSADALMNEAPQASSTNVIDKIILAVREIIAESKKEGGDIITPIAKIAKIALGEGEADGLLDVVIDALKNEDYVALTKDSNKSIERVVVKFEKIVTDLIETTAGTGIKGLVGSMTQSFGLYTGTGNEKAEYTLGEILNKAEVADSIATLINSIVYEGLATKQADAISAWKMANEKGAEETEEAYEARAIAAIFPTEDGVAYFATYEAFITGAADYTIANQGFVVSTADTLVALVKDATGLTIDTADFYKGLKITADVITEAGMGLGLTIENGVAAETISASLTFDIVGVPAAQRNIVAIAVEHAQKRALGDNPATEEEETDFDLGVEYSTYTAEDGGALLFNALKILANGIYADDIAATAKYALKVETGITLTPVVIG